MSSSGTSNLRKVIWHPRGESRFLLAGGNDIRLVEWEQPNETHASPCLRLVASQPDVHLLKSVAWSPHPSVDDLVACGLSTGRTVLFRLSSSLTVLPSASGSPSLVSYPGLVTLNVRHSRACNSLAFCPSEAGLLAAGLDKVRSDFCLQVWDVEAATRFLTASGEVGSGDGRALQTELKPIAQYGRAEGVNSITWLDGGRGSWGPAGRQLLAGMGGKLIRLYDLRMSAAATSFGQMSPSNATPSTSAPLTYTTKAVHGLVADPFNPFRFASHSVDTDGVIKLWDVRKPSEYLLSWSEAQDAGNGWAAMDARDVSSGAHSPTAISGVAAARLANQRSPASPSTSRFPGSSQFAPLAATAAAASSNSPSALAAGGSAAGVARGGILSSVAFSPSRPGVIAAHERETGVVRLWQIQETQAFPLVNGGGTHLDVSPENMVRTNKWEPTDEDGAVGGLVTPSSVLRGTHNRGSMDARSLHALDSPPVLAGTRRVPPFSQPLSIFTFASPGSTAERLPTDDLHLLGVSRNGQVVEMRHVPDERVQRWSGGRVGDFTVTEKQVGKVSGDAEEDLDEGKCSHAAVEALRIFRSTDHGLGPLPDMIFTDQTAAHLRTTPAMRDMVRSPGDRASGSYFPPFPSDVSDSPMAFGTSFGTSFSTSTSGPFTPTINTSNLSPSARVVRRSSSSERPGSSRLARGLNSAMDNAATTIEEEEKKNVDSGGQRKVAWMVNMDISMVVRRRAQQGYGMDPSKNLRIIRDTHGSGSHLEELWQWIERAVQHAKGNESLVDGFDFSFHGVLGAWLGFPLCSSSPSPSVSSEGTSTARATTFHVSEGAFGAAAAALNAKRGVTVSNVIQGGATSSKPAQRKLALSMCGEDFGTLDGESVLAKLESRGQFARAAGWAFFVGNTERAIQALKRSRDERHKLMTGILAAHLAAHGPAGRAGKGVMSPDIDPGTSKVFEETCGSLSSSIDDPHLRAVLTYVAGGEWEEVLDEESLPLAERLAIALRFLSDESLTSYLTKTAHRLIARGDPEGILLTGLTADGMSLLASYLDRTGDLQTPALVASYVHPALLQSPAAERWIEDYRFVLDGWRMYMERIRFDQSRGRWAREMAMGNVAGGGECTAASLIGVPKPQLRIRCNFCQKSISHQYQTERRTAGALPKDGGGGGLGEVLRRGGKAAGETQRITHCPHCNRTLPRCPICLLPPGEPIDPVFELERSKHRLLPNGKILDAFAICHSCKHGGHSQHVLLHFYGADGTLPLSAEDVLPNGDGTSMLGDERRARRGRKTCAVPGCDCVCIDP